MCGLVGAFTTNPAHNNKINDVFVTLLHLDVLRGADSTGVAIGETVWSTPKYTLNKSVGGPTEYLREHGVGQKKKDVLFATPTFLLGHNRFATQGAISVENAHPFEFDNVIGMHNGTVFQSSLKDFHGYKDYNVDSQIIYSQLSYSQDIDTVWKNADGAMALAYWDKTGKTLNLIRNKERPLFFVYTKDNKTVYFASERWMLHIATSRVGEEIQDVLELPCDNKLFTFFRNKQLCVEHFIKEVTPFTKKIIPFQYPSQKTGYYSNYYDDWDEWEKQGNDKRETSKSSASVSHMREIGFVITQVSPNPPTAPFAVGITDEGDSILISIPSNKFEEAKKKIIGRGSKAKYVTKKAYVPHRDPNFDWQVWWVNAEWERPTPKNEIAPWFAPSHHLSRAAWTEKVECGCYNCTNKPFWSTKNDIVWLDKETFVCKACKDLPDVLNFILDQNHQKTA